MKKEKKRGYGQGHSPLTYVYSELSVILGFGDMCDWWK